MISPQNSTVFEFVERSWEKGNPEATFVYRTHFEGGESLVFTEKLIFGDAGWAERLREEFIENIMDDLHIVLGISYYKLFVPQAFKIERSLSDAQAHFFNTLYRKGLGEFVYRNNLSFTRIATFEGGGNDRGVSLITSNAEKVLVGIGGGKDSIVALELLKGYERIGFEVATNKESNIIEEVSSLAGVPLVKIKRVLDPQVLAGVPGSYNGHVPISSVYAFLGVLQAALSGAAHVVVSNEHSSNFGNVVHEGEEINHKWSGSAEFESLFQSYVREHLTPSVRYFSLTRPFYELRVVQHFTEIGERYFHTFSSCNRNFAHDHRGEKRWCGECPKCAFAFLSLAAFLEREKVVSIFGKDLFEDEMLIPLFKDLLGFGTMKPFDCVGTFEESRVAFSRAKDAFADSVVMRNLLPLIDETTLSSEVFKVQKADTVPSRFRMLGMRSALILGYGKEGMASEQYLKKRYPHIALGIADKKDGEAYLATQHAYDITVKTPGIPSSLILRQSVSATQFFFSEVGRERIIGVTGSKGKSTTATLTYRMLKNAGISVHLVGNIGVPALEYLLHTDIGADDLFVYELSSYQLEDLDVSPHVAIVTSLFPEHIDHHGSLPAYYEAKRTILRYQDGKDVLIAAPGFPLLSEWVKEAHAQKVPIETLSFTPTSMSLRGEHMQSNAALAFTAAKHFGAELEDVRNVCNAFEGLPHRLQHLGSYKGIEFYDDSISTTPESAIAGIRALKDVDTIILGGVDRGYDFSALEQELRQSGIRNIVLFPESGEHMLSSEDGFNILHTASMDEAVAFAYQYTAEGKSCLLSPAAPSYNLFTNFEERGRAFYDVVKKYGTV